MPSSANNSNKNEITKEWLARIFNNMHKTPNSKVDALYNILFKNVNILKTVADTNSVYNKAIKDEGSVYNKAKSVYINAYNKAKKDKDKNKDSEYEDLPVDNLPVDKINNNEYNEGYKDLRIAKDGFTNRVLADFLCLMTIKHIDDQEIFKKCNKVINIENDDWKFTAECGLKCFKYGSNGCSLRDKVYNPNNYNPFNDNCQNCYVKNIYEGLSKKLKPTSQPDRTKAQKARNNTNKLIKKLVEYINNNKHIKEVSKDGYNWIRVLEKSTDDLEKLGKKVYELAQNLRVESFRQNIDEYEKTIFDILDYIFKILSALKSGEYTLLAKIQSMKVIAYMNLCCSSEEATIEKSYGDIVDECEQLLRDIQNSRIKNKAILLLDVSTEAWNLCMAIGKPFENKDTSEKIKKFENIFRDLIDKNINKIDKNMNKNDIIFMIYCTKNLMYRFLVASSPYYHPKYYDLIEIEYICDIGDINRYFILIINKFMVTGSEIISVSLFRIVTALLCMINDFKALAKFPTFYGEYDDWMNVKLEIVDFDYNQLEKKLTTYKNECQYYFNLKREFNEKIRIEVFIDSFCPPAIDQSVKAELLQIIPYSNIILN